MSMSQNDGTWMPPHSVEAEQAVIGGLLIDQGAMTQVADVVRADDFFRRAHQLVCKAALQIDERGEVPDLLTIIEELHQAGDLEDVGGREYLGRLARDTPSAANVRVYAQIVRDRSIERQLIQRGMEFRRIVEEPGEVSAKLDRAQQSVLDIGREASGGPVLVRQHMPAWVDDIDERFRSGGQIVGLATGFRDLDYKLGGLRSGNMVIIAGRPSMGKTAIGMQISGNTAESGAPALVFSMEMPASELIDRQVASVGRVPMTRIRSGQLLDEDWAKVASASKIVNDWPLIIDESPALTVTDVRARSRRVKQQHGLGLILIDYLQLMGGDGDTRQDQVAAISRGLKRMAKELEVPVIALSQLNRSLEQRPNKRPVMSDLRESGALEQDADTILFVYRDEVYHSDSPDRGTAEIIIGKQRSGPTGMVRLVYQGEYTRFENLARDAYEDMRRANEDKSAAPSFEDL